MRHSWLTKFAAFCLNQPMTCYYIVQFTHKDFLRPHLTFAGGAPGHLWHEHSLLIRKRQAEILRVVINSYCSGLENDPRFDAHIRLETVLFSRPKLVPGSWYVPGTWYSYICNASCCTEISVECRMWNVYSTSYIVLKIQSILINSHVSYICLLYTSDAADE